MRFCIVEMNKWKLILSVLQSGSSAALNYLPIASNVC